MAASLPCNLPTRIFKCPYHLLPRNYRQYGHLSWDLYHYLNFSSFNSER